VTLECRHQRRGEIDSTQAGPRLRLLQDQASAETLWAFGPTLSPARPASAAMPPGVPLQRTAHRESAFLQVEVRPPQPEGFTLTQTERECHDESHTVSPLRVCSHVENLLGFLNGEWRDLVGGVRG
jgi:hypothetical protein